MKKRLSLYLAIVPFLLTASAVAQTAPAELPVWRNRTRTPDERARDLLKQLTLEEKIALVHADGTFSTAGVPRLGVGKMWMSDGPQGVREEIQPLGWNSANRTDDFATAMPANIGLAATFDKNLAVAFGNVIGQEALVRHKNIMLCPGLNIMRTPLNGRNSEYFGEDPFLASRMAVGFINGLQQNGVAACAKHYALNNQETSRNSVNVHVDERTMREIYLPAFKAAVTEAHVWSIMTGYNRVNGSYCSESDFLLNQVLKKDWNFQGLVMTDWGGTHSTINAAVAGLDLEMGSNVTGNHNNDYLAAPLLAAVKAGQVPQARLDDMALRNLRVMAATGLLDEAHLDSTLTTRPSLMSPEHIETARQIAESACVLLKNSNNVLPLDAKAIKSIAIIGDNAKAKFAYDGMSAQIKTKYEITPFDGITKRAGDAGGSIKISYAQGYARTGGGRRGGGAGGGAAGGAGGAPAGNQALIDEAVNAAKAADVAIVVAGLYRGQDQEAADRPSMNLPPGQAELIAAVTKANPKTIVVLNGGSPSVVDPWISDAAGLLMSWYGGTEGGNGLARVLFGDVNPAGHLPCTWPKQLADSPAHNPANAANFPGTGAGGRGGGNAATNPEAGPQVTYAEGLYVGYRWFEKKKIEPQFPFGFGLSYTTFKVESLGLEVAGTRDGRPAAGSLPIDVVYEVSNTGKRDGAAVIQLYVEPVKSGVDRPIKELKGFSKVQLQAGQTLKEAIRLTAADFAYYSTEKHAWVAEAGDYIIHVGDSSASLPVSRKFHIDKTLTVNDDGALGQ